MPKTKPANPKRKSTTSELPKTTAQQLGALIKSARGIMRKDKGLNGDLDRLPLLTWIMFLKFLDDRERLDETRARVSGRKYKPALEPPYRWRDWAAPADGITGDALTAFVNQEEAPRPDGKRGPGLLAYLRSLRATNGDRRRDVVSTVFGGVVNRMVSGYLLRDVINLVDGIHFVSTEEIHTLARLYETMLREMRDAAGDSGEFYTPRPVIQFMVVVTDPRIGEVVLDPACGTGGFLAEAFAHLERQCKTVQDREQLQKRSIRGGEAKPLPYMLSQMNLLLHGLDEPTIDYGNSLAVKISELGDSDRVDVILTNPPFGGEEERSILANFPPDKQTTETALLFLQLIMRKLRRGARPGRAAVVVPDGVLTQEGIAVRVRAALVNEYNLHTVVRLPKGVFEPYTKSSTSILFFDTGEPSDDVWFYEIPIRPELKAYTQHKPFTFSECDDAIEWWSNRKPNERAWRVTRSDIAAQEYNLNCRNPNGSDGSRFPAPARGYSALAATIADVAGICATHQSAWNRVSEAMSRSRPERSPLSALVSQVRREVPVVPGDDYQVLAMSWYAKGLYIKHEKGGDEIKAAKLYRVQKDDFVYNRLFAWKGAFAEVDDDAHGCLVSNEFPVFKVVDARIVPGYLWAYFSQPALWDHIESLSTGTTSTSRLRLKERKLLSFSIPILPREIQVEMASLLRETLVAEQRLRDASELQSKCLPAVLERVCSTEVV
jgi:type I restriction enzyme M protein